MRPRLASLTILLMLGATATTRAQSPMEARTTRLAEGVYVVEMPTDPMFVGCNCGFVLMRDGVLVIDAGFPLAARIALAEIRKITDLPVRWVLDTHAHADHCYGNGVFAAEGATIIAQRACAATERGQGAREFATMAAADSDRSRTLIGGASFRAPTLVFDDQIEFDDGARRVEVLFFGTAHTPGDAVAWLPAERVLFSGDACVNGAFNFMGDGDSESWIRVLDRMAGLGAEKIAPGHGAPADGGLLARQKRWFVELRAAVARGIDAGLAPAAIAASLDMPWYREWTGVDANSRSENARRVYDELVGLAPPRAFIEELGLEEGPSPTRDDADWTAPKRIVLVGPLADAAARLAPVAPGVELIEARDEETAVAALPGADALVGGCSPRMLEAGTTLRWIQVGSAGVERYVALPGLRERDLVLTNAQRLYGPEMADHVLGMILALTRRLDAALDAQRAGRWDRGGLDHDAPFAELKGKTVLIAGLGGIGVEVARRVHACGARVLATKGTPDARYSFVDAVGGPQRLAEFAAEADVVVNCLPLSAATERLFDAAFFDGGRRGMLFVNVGRGRSVDTGALLAALGSGQVRGAALDVTDPEPLPSDHPLWRAKNVLITPHVAAQSDGQDERLFRLMRENLRRFVAGERLLSVVDRTKGY